MRLDVKVRNQCAVVPLRVIYLGCIQTFRAIITMRLLRVSGYGQRRRLVFQMLRSASRLARPEGL
jgi:hypothetical protein